jgi:hypothetical protein
MDSRAIILLIPLLSHLMKAGNIVKAANGHSFTLVRGNN